MRRYISSKMSMFGDGIQPAEMSEAHKAQINNRIHYLAGRLMRLLDAEVICTDHDLDDIVVQVSGMSPSLFRNMIATLRG